MWWRYLLKLVREFGVPDTAWRSTRTQHSSSSLLHSAARANYLLKMNFIFFFYSHCTFLVFITWFWSCVSGAGRALAQLWHHTSRWSTAQEGSGWMDDLKIMQNLTLAKHVERFKNKTTFTDPSLELIPPPVSQLSQNGHLPVLSLSISSLCCDRYWLD